MSNAFRFRLGVMIFGMVACLMLPACRTVEDKSRDAEKTSSSSEQIQEVISELKAIIIPEMTFYSPATIVDAVESLKMAAKTGKSQEQHTLRFELNLPSASTNVVAPRIAALTVRAINLFDAIQLVCEATDMKWRIQQDGTVRIYPQWLDMDEDAVTRTYIVPQALADALLNTPNDQPSEADADKSSFMPTDQPSDVAADKAWKAFFEQLGVTEPKWTTFNYLPLINKLRVTSTLETLELIDSVMDHFSLQMIEVEMQIHAFRTADIERLRLSGGVSLESLTALRQKGKSRKVAFATARTKSGHEAVVKAVQEVIYPAEFNRNVGQANSNMTVRSTSEAMIPTDFRMWEIGMILQVAPETMQGGTMINLKLKPQWVTLEGWKSYPAALASAWTLNTPSLKQPVVGVTSFETQTMVKDGETVLVGSCSTPDGEWVQVGFLTARLGNVKPLYVGKLTDKATSQDAQKDTVVVKKMREIVIPDVTFRPPATIIDAIRFIKEASIQYDKTTVPQAQRGLNFVLNLSANSGRRTRGGEQVYPFAVNATDTNNIPVIPALSARFINLYDALRLVCDVTGMKFKIRDNIVWVVPFDDPCENLMTRTYRVLPSLFEELSADTNSREGEKVWKEFFAQMGVNWPIGSSVSFKNLSFIRVLRIKNTPENLAVFEQVLEDLEITPRMVEVDVQIHAFPTEEIEQVSLSGDMSVESLMALRKKGKSKQVASATIVTKSGQEAIVRGVREISYPTELFTDGVHEGSAIVTPGNFEMREVGTILQVVPEITTPDGSQIDVLIKPQWITLDGWEAYPSPRRTGWASKRFPFKQPVFGLTNFETEALVKTGDTVLLGSTSTPDGKWVQVGFLTVKECR